jgi:glycine cleavage system H protein
VTEPAADLHYTADHEWIAVDGDVATVGITAYAAEKLGDVVYVDLPKVGATVSAATVVGEIESTKSVGELFAPVAGEVVEINPALGDAPETVGEAPETVGWFAKLKLADASEVEKLMDKAAYEAFLQTL